MSQQKKTPAKPLRYFFFHGDLHKKIYTDRGSDLITCWNYPKGKVMQYVYSDVLKNGGQAFTTKQVMKMLRRGRTTIEMGIVEGKIPSPQMQYSMEKRHGHAWYWSEDGVMAAHEYLKTVHIGRPRKDGLINSGNLPSAREVRAMMNHGTVFYVQDESGNFVPTWDANRF